MRARTIGVLTLFIAHGTSTPAQTMTGEPAVDSAGVARTVRRLDDGSAGSSLGAEPAASAVVQDESGG